MLRTSSFDPSNNDELLGKSLDLIEKMQWSNWPIINTSSSNVKLRPLVPDGLVLRKVLDIVKNPTWGKLGPN